MQSEDARLSVTEYGQPSNRRMPGRPGNGIPGSVALKSSEDDRVPICRLAIALPPCVGDVRAGAADHGDSQGRNRDTIFAKAVSCGSSYTPRTAIEDHVHVVLSIPPTVAVAYQTELWPTGSCCRPGAGRGPSHRYPSRSERGDAPDSRRTRAPAHVRTEGPDDFVVAAISCTGMAGCTPNARWRGPRRRATACAAGGSMRAGRPRACS